MKVVSIEEEQMQEESQQGSIQLGQEFVDVIFENFEILF